MFSLLHKLCSKTKHQHYFALNISSYLSNVSKGQECGPHLWMIYEQRLFLIACKCCLLDRTLHSLRGRKPPTLAIMDGHLVNYTEIHAFFDTSVNEDTFFFRLANTPTYLKCVAYNFYSVIISRILF